MKYNILKKITLFAFLAISVLVSDSGCNKFQNIGDGVKLIIDYNLIKTTVDLQLVDASTNQLVGFDGSVSVTTKITGDDKDGVIDITGVRNPNYEYKSQMGFVSLAILPEAAFLPSNENPISFNVVVQHDGYLSTSQHIVIASEGRNFVPIKMVKIDTPPNGVVVIVTPGATTTDTEGRVENPVIVETPAGRSQLEIPEGLIVLDSAGVPLQGNLNVTLVHFDNTEQEALEAFPGGLSGNVTRLDGSAEDGMFYSAGFVAIEISDDQGRKAATFENGTLALISEINGDTYNPETQANVVAGDQVPLWSYDEYTGRWTEEDNLVIIGSNGTMQVLAQLTHLSYYNFDWFYGGQNCYTGSTFIFTADAPLCDCVMLSGVMYRQSDNTFMKYVYMWVCGTDPVYTYYAPAGVPVYIVWDNNYSNFTVNPANNPTYITDLCSTDPVNIGLVVNNTSTTIYINVEVYCPDNPDAIIRPSFGAYFRPIDSYNWRWAEMVTGNAEICDVILGQTYVVGIYYDGEWYETEVLIDQTSYNYIGYEIPADVCAEIFP